MPKLVVVEGPNRGAVLSIVAGDNRMGRDAGAEVTLPDPLISRQHATLLYDPSRAGDGRVQERAVLSDHGSRNGTYLNGLRIGSSHPVAHGDEIRIGDTVLLYIEDEAGEAAREPPSLSLVQADTTSRSSVSKMPTVPVELTSRLDAPRRHYLVGASEALGRVAELIERCAALDSTVLITGESGTGKELVAEALHRLGPRRQAPFVVVNCATLEPALLESDLFGHERGAFTGAVARKLGKLELAQGGTLFLDEVGELRAEAQAKLLRAIDRREFQRLGARDMLKTTARFVAATHRDLAAMAAEGRFREDLLFRLRVVEITIPPLRERREDIEPLTRHFLTELRRKIPTRVQGFTPEALDQLGRYPFPGNVRELRNVVERCLIFCDRENIDVPNLPAEVRGAISLPTVPRATALTPAPLARATEDETVGAASGAIAVNGEAMGIGTLEEMEKTLIHKALLASEGNKSKAARLLAIDRNTLYAKIKRFGLGRPGDRPEPT